VRAGLRQSKACQQPAALAGETLAEKQRPPSTYRKQREECEQAGWVNRARRA